MLQGNSGWYKPLYPDLESGIPLVGLVYRILPADQLAEDKLPAPIDTLSQLAEALLPLVGPDAREADFAMAYREQSDSLGALRKRLEEEYRQFKRKFRGR